MNNPGFDQSPTDTYSNGNAHEKMANGKVNTDPNKVVAVLGSGDYGRALSGRLVRSGYEVFIGSRDPNKNLKIREMVASTGATLTTQDVALSHARVVIIAVGRDNYDALPLSQLVGKVVVDVSNNTKSKKGPHHRSNAEYLQGLTRDTEVVKSFNVLSAYALENGGLQGSKEVFLASDFPEAKSLVSQMVRDMGFTPVDWGALKAARDIEEVPLRLMPSWKKPVKVAFGVFLGLWIMSFIQFQICMNSQYYNWTWGWKHLGMQNFNRTIAICAIWTLALCYLPGLIAAYLQLWRGTKYSRFPAFLDDWLKMRKQLGLLMLGMAAIHACISVAVLTPQSTAWVYEDPKEIEVLVPGENGTTTTSVVKEYNFEFNWRGELFLTMGAVSTCLLTVLGISSLPSVTATLSWREFTFIQSKLGWVAMVVAVLHDIFLAWYYMFLYKGCYGYLPIGPQYALYLPMLCIILKIPLLIPPVDNHLQRIRGGYERPPRGGKKTEMIA
ncbi:metalloreductase STEAP3-like isoform X2 [Oratosquilla oratoria]